MPDVALEAARFIAGRPEEHLALADIADHVGYSPFHLTRCFERRLGVPPGQFLAAHRFQRAKALLLSSGDRVIDVCFAVGFTSVGTFTRRFTEAVGVSPTEFRRLPHALADAPPEPVRLPGAATTGGTVTGTVRLSAASRAVLPDGAAVYIGLFPHRAARGVPIAGALLDDRGRFALTEIPSGRYWLLATALTARADPLAQLVPDRHVVGGSPHPVRITAMRPHEQRDVHLDVAEPWVAPVLVALPPLACPTQQDRRRRG